MSIITNFEWFRHLWRSWVSEFALIIESDCVPAQIEKTKPEWVGGWAWGFDSHPILFLYGNSLSHFNSSMTSFLSTAVAEGTSSSDRWLWMQVFNSKDDSIVSTIEGLEAKGFNAVKLLLRGLLMLNLNLKWSLLSLRSEAKDSRWETLMRSKSQMMILRYELHFLIYT